MSANKDRLPAKIHGDGGVASILERMKPQIQMALARHLDPDRFVRVALTTLQRTPALMRCTKESFFGSLMECAQLGLEPDGVFGLAYLIPYGDQCTLVPGYKGLLELLRRSGEVADCYSEIVREGDGFNVVKGLHRDLVHEPADDNHDAKVTHVYNVAVLKDGTARFEVMTVAEVEAIRKRSKAGKSGPWVTDWNEMAKKTVFKRHAKWLPASAELRKAIDLDDRVYEREPTKLDIGTIDVPAVDGPRTDTVAEEARERQREINELRQRCTELGVSYLDEDTPDDLRERIVEREAQMEEAQA